MRGSPLRPASDGPDVPRRPETMKTLVLGMGNPILCDDRVGLRLTAELRACSAACSGLVTISDCTVGGLNLLDVVAGFDRLIVLDSIKTAGGKPGSWYYFRGSSLQETMNLSNVHDANFATTLELGRRMGMKLPADDDIHVFAVEVADNLSFGESLTPELEEALPEIADEILAEIRELLAAPTADCRYRTIGGIGAPTPIRSRAAGRFRKSRKPREKGGRRHIWSRQLGGTMTAEYVHIHYTGATKDTPARPR